MMQLTEELTGTENKISRVRFNDSVMGYNTAVEQFPSNVIAGAFSFKQAELLQATESPDEKKPVRAALTPEFRRTAAGRPHLSFRAQRGISAVRTAEILAALGMTRRAALGMTRCARDDAVSCATPR